MIIGAVALVDVSVGSFASILAYPPSGLPRSTDIIQAFGHIGFVPFPEVGGPHSITSSARARRVGGMVRPSALAALRLMTVVYLSI
jgi:hypothetical protein